MGVATDIVGMKTGKAPVGKSKDSSGEDTGSRAKDLIGNIHKFHRGGKVRSTGLARLKKGERVLTKGQQRKAGLLKKR